MSQVLIQQYFLPVEIRQELDLPVVRELYTRALDMFNDSTMRVNDFGYYFDTPLHSMSYLADELADEFQEALFERDDDPWAEKKFNSILRWLLDVTAANQQAFDWNVNTWKEVEDNEAWIWEEHARKQHFGALIPSFQDFVARCPAPREPTWEDYRDDQSQYSQSDFGRNGPTGYAPDQVAPVLLWDVCSSYVDLSDLEREQILAGSELLGPFTKINPRKRPYEMDDEPKMRASKRVYDWQPLAPTTPQPVHDIGDLFPIGWERSQEYLCYFSNEDVSPLQPAPDNSREYWENWQPEPDLRNYHVANWTFHGLPDYEVTVVSSIHPVVEPAPRQISPAKAWLLENVSLPPNSFNSEYEEPQHLALTPMVTEVPTVQYPLNHGHNTMPASRPCLLNDPVRRPTTPPWRRRGWADTSEGERVFNNLPLSPTNFLRAQAQNLLNQFKEHPVPDITDLLPHKTRMRPVQKDIVNLEFYNPSSTRRLTIAQRRGQYVRHLKRFWDIKVSRDE
jgi:hypothetical protein